jgi:hypothetical protein
VSSLPRQRIFLTNSYYQLLDAFKSTNGPTDKVYNMISRVASSCRDPTLLGNFIENHDAPRFASYVSSLHPRMTPD